MLRAFDRFRILCAVPMALGRPGAQPGRAAELAQAGLLQPAGEWFVGRPVMVTRNDAALGVFNGDVGVAASARSSAGRADGAGGAASDGGSGGALRARFLDGDALRSVSVSRLAHVDTAFICHDRPQKPGSEFAHTVLVMAPEPVA